MCRALLMLCEPYPAQLEKNVGHGNYRFISQDEIWDEEDWDEVDGMIYFVNTPIQSRREGAIVPGTEPGYGCDGYLSGAR